MEHDIELEDIGWKVLQQRRVHVEKLLRQALRTALADGGTAYLLDLALGSGRQVLEILRSLPGEDIHAELRDVDEANLERGRQLANQLGLTRANFAVMDAFDERSLMSIDARTNVVAATGIFELTPDNHKIAATLAGIAARLPTGGQLVYTDQPHHPSLEMIGQVAVQRDESPWAMRRRPVEEMDGLLTDAGFELIERLTDSHGLFSVGLAKKSPH